MLGPDREYRYKRWFELCGLAKNLRAATVAKLVKSEGRKALRNLSLFLSLICQFLSIQSFYAFPLYFTTHRNVVIKFNGVL